MTSDNFNKLLSLNVNEYVEAKNGLNYLSWSYAWAEFKKIYPDATYEVIKFDNGDMVTLPYMYDEKTGYMCCTRVTADNITHEMWLPVMDNRNKAMLECTMFDINKTIMRCLTKNLAMFGLGLYIYAGEDLPEALSDDKSTTGLPTYTPSKTEAKTKTPKTSVTF